MDYKEHLLSMIEHLVRGEWSVPEFEKHYYLFYVEEVPDEALSDVDSSFFGSVQERLDWTHAEPDATSRGYGWLNHEEFRSWVVEELKRYRAAQRLGDASEA